MFHRGYADNSAAYDLFFGQRSQKFSGIGEKATPGAIRSWLDRFFLSQRQFHPSLLVKEDGPGEFALDVAIDFAGSAGVSPAPGNVDVSPALADKGVGAPILLKDILHNRSMAAKRFTILKELSLLSSLIKGLELYINRYGATPITFTLEEFTPFLFSTIPAIRLLGVKVLLPKSLQSIIRPKVSMKLSKKQTDGKTYLRLDEMLQFDWQVALGDKLVTPAEFEKLTRRATGLNLTAASHVIHFDLWWNPAVEAQATDRAYRIGQHQNVLVHRFITQNTFEERIDQMIQDKRHLADMTVATGESWIGKLSNSELREIFK